jgi:integrase
MVGLAGFEPTTGKRPVFGGNEGRFPVWLCVYFLVFPALRYGLLRGHWLLMASVHKQRGSRFWYGYFRLRGRLIGRSTGETDKARALAVAMAWEKAVKGDAPADQGQARRVMTELLAGIMEQRIERVTVGGFLESWLAAIEGTVAGSTMSFYRGAAGAFVAFVGPERKIDGIGQKDVVRWRASEAERVSVSTANNRLKAVRALLEAAVRDGHLRANPAGGIKALRKGKVARKRRPFSREEIRKVLAVADGDWRLMIQLGLETGQRLGDLVRMDWADVDLDRAVWTLTAGKTGRRLLIPLGHEVVGALRDRGLRPSGEVFPSLVGRLGAEGKVGLLSNDFADLLWRAGLRRYSPHDRIAKGGRKARLVDEGSDRREQQELSFHSLRHTTRTWLEEAGQPKAVIDALVGHSGDMGKTYTTVGIDALRAAAAALRAGK